MPSCLGRVGSVRAMQMPQSRACGQRGPDLLAGDPPAAVDLLALVVSPARSEPAPGSLNSWHQRCRRAAWRAGSAPAAPACRTAISAGTTQAPMTRSCGFGLRPRSSSCDDELLERPASRPHGVGRCGMHPAGRGQPRRSAPGVGRRRSRPARRESRRGALGVRRQVELGPGGAPPRASPATRSRHDAGATRAGRAATCARR